MKKNLLIVGALILAAAGAVIAGGPDFGRALWFQHTALYPATQTITAGATITADACGGVKRISAASAATTSTSNSFTAPSALNSGCVMDVINVGPAPITIDSNAIFPTKNAADAVLDSSGTIKVVSVGSYWMKVGMWTQY